MCENGKYIFFFLLIQVSYFSFSQDIEKYKTILSKADSSFDFHFSSKDKKDYYKYLVAKNYYVEASKIMPLEKYPIERVKEIDKILYSLKYEMQIRKLKSEARTKLSNGEYISALEDLNFADSLLKKGNINDNYLADRKLLLKDLIKIESRDSASVFLSNVLKADAIFNEQSKWISKYSYLILAVDYYEKALIIYSNSIYIKMKLNQFVSLSNILFEPTFHENERTGELIEYQKHERKQVLEMQNKIRIKLD